MARFFIIVLLLTGIRSLLAQTDLLQAGVYAWPTGKDKSKSGFNVSMLSGTAADLSHLEMNAIGLAPKKKLSINDNSEHVLFVKSGTLTITMRDSTWVLEKGSVVLILPNEKVSLQNKSAMLCTFQEMKYQSKLPMEIVRGVSSGGSIVRDWNKLAFKPHERGGVRSYFNRPTAMAKRFEMHVTTLNANTPSHDPHTHVAEEIILVLEGDIDMLIGDRHYQATAGDALFAPTKVLHGLKNRGNTPCSYFAYQWE